jgi:hypothetical protein
VDNVVFVGSPGVGVDTADELGVPTDRVWAGAAKNDPVPDISPTHGNDPTESDFKGNTFYVEPGKEMLTDGATPAHSQYWEGKSLESVVSIALGGEGQAPPREKPNYHFEWSRGHG